MKLLQELAHIEQEIDAIPLFEAIEESVRELQLTKKGGKVKSTIAGAKDFFKANPGLTIAAAAMAVSAYSAYEKNKRHTIRLHAKTTDEKAMMTSIVDTLTQGKKFKIEKIKFEHGGKTWIVKRIGD